MNKPALAQDQGGATLQHEDSACLCACRGVVFVALALC